LKYDEKSETIKCLKISGVCSAMKTNKKDIAISLGGILPNDTTTMSSITLETNDKNTRCYLPVINNDKNNTNEFILLSIDKPHI
jgi:hypothetical protein